MAQSIREAMTTNPICLPATASIQEAARAMRDHDIGHIIIEKEGVLCGIITD
jgi:CBS domain-containing protein